MTLTVNRWGRFLLLAVGAVCTGLMLILPKLGLLQWITLIPVGIFLLKFASDPQVRLRRLYGYGLFFFYIYYLTGFEFFVNLYPLDFIDGMTKGAAVAVVLVAWLGLSLLQALFGGLSFVVAGLIFRTAAARRYPFLRPFLGAGIWAVYEWTQTLGWWGVPWSRLPLGQREYLLGLQNASLLGSYLVTFMLVAVNFCLAYALISFIENGFTLRSLRRGCIAAAVLLVLQYGSGTVLWIAKDKEPAAEETPSVTVAVIQGNFSSQEKWGLGTASEIVRVYGDYTKKAAEQGAELVIWPETALPYTVKEGNWAAEDCSAIAKEAGVTVLVGAFTETPTGGDYNSLICFLPDGSIHEQTYAKRRLVPFGEFVPLRGLIETVIPPLADLVLSGEDVTPGEGAQVMDLEQGRIGGLICFDSLYEDLSRESVLGGAELITLSTNDSWFTDSFALYMHNGQAQLRAIETGRYVARAANTGVSTVISDRGEVLLMLDPLVDGMLVTEVALIEEHTPYTYLGNSFVYVWILGLLFLFLAELPRKVGELREKFVKNRDENSKKA